MKLKTITSFVRDKKFREFWQGSPWRFAISENLSLSVQLRVFCRIICRLNYVTSSFLGWRVKHRSKLYGRERICEWPTAGNRGSGLKLRCLIFLSICPLRRPATKTTNSTFAKRTSFENFIGDVPYEFLLRSWNYRRRYMLTKFKRAPQDSNRIHILAS